MEATGHRAAHGAVGPVHIHEYRDRLLLSDARVSTYVAIFQCADRGRCGAVTRVLPAFLARHLWRAWQTVEAAVADSGETATGSRLARSCADGRKMAGSTSSVGGGAR